MAESTKSSGLRETFASLSDRERKGIMFLAVFLPLLLVVFLTMLFQRSMADIEAEADRYKSALDLLATAGPAYADQKESSGQAQSHKAISDEDLSNNDIKLTSFVAEHADAAGITVSSYDEDELPFGKKDEGGPIIVEKQLRVEIRKADIDKLIGLLDRIEKSREPVFVKRVDIRKRRKAKGEVRSILTVSTFVRKDQES